MPRVRRLLVAAVGVAGLALYAWPGWDVGKWTAGMFRMSMTRYYYDDGDFEPSNLVFHEDGLSTTVTVEQDSGSRWVKVNGKIDGSSEGDMPTQVLSGVLPMVLRDGARSIAVIGCGSGVTVGAALRSNPERITLVELESAMIRAAHLFESVNHAFWADPRVTIVEDDGRNFMGRRGPLYDVIISEPSNPWMTGAASLFTVEFFRLASARLNPDGTFLQWLQIYELAPERIASVLKTFQAVFPHVLVFTPALDSNDLLIVGRRTPWQLDWQGGQARFAALAGEMERAEVTDFAELLTQLLFSDREIAALPVEIPLNTDDNAFIEFGAPRDLLTFAEDDPEVSPIDATRGKRAQLLADLGLGPTGAVDEATSAHLTRLAQAYLGQGMLADARAATALALAAAPPAEVAAEAREVGTLADLFEEDDREMVTDSGPCLNDTAYLQALTLLQADEEKKALEAIAATKDFDTRSGAHALLHGFLLYRDSQYGAARQALLRARQDEDLANHQRAIAYYLAKGSFEAGEYQRASDEMIAYLRLPAPVLSPTPKAD
jgi:spermidine synthase